MVNEALFCTGVTTLFRDPWGGLALVPLITILLLLINVDNLIAGEAAGVFQASKAGAVGQQVGIRPSHCGGCA